MTRTPQFGPDRKKQPIFTDHTEDPPTERSRMAVAFEGMTDAFTGLGAASRRAAQGLNAIRKMSQQEQMPLGLSFGQDDQGRFQLCVHSAGSQAVEDVMATKGDTPPMDDWECAKVWMPYRKVAHTLDSIRLHPIYGRWVHDITQTFAGDSHRQKTYELTIGDGVYDVQLELAEYPDGMWWSDGECAVTYNDAGVHHRVEPYFVAVASGRPLRRAGEPIKDKGLFNWRGKKVPKTFLEELSKATVEKMTLYADGKEIGEVKSFEVTPLHTYQDDNPPSAGTHDFYRTYKSGETLSVTWTYDITAE